ncbi:MAG: hypothetical protein KJ634_00500 [Gammaproteobacteria bacterium]|nr:hypothetical protein [Gammaproteobacteria bacterium]MBU1414079.1 hypothetical protein [Gammaproteobacteria bacterium]
MPRNPELFELTAGLAMAQLYEKFPIPKDIDFRALYAEVSDRFPDASMSDYIKIYLVIRHTFEWLQKEDFIRYESIGENAARNLQLTEKGLRALKAVPKELDAQRQSLAEFLVESAKEGAKEALMKGVGWLLAASAS